MVQNMEKNPKSIKSDKRKKNKTKKNLIKADKLQSKNEKASRSSSIDELLKICRPLTVRMTRCDHIIEQRCKLTAIIFQL